MSRVPRAVTRARGSGCAPIRSEVVLVDCDGTGDPRDVDRPEDLPGR